MQCFCCRLHLRAPPPIITRGNAEFERRTVTDDVKQNGRKLSRRRFLKWTVFGGVGVVAGGVVDAFLIEPWWPKVTHPVIAIPSLPPSWDGVRIAHLTDFHVGRFLDLDDVRGVIDTTLAEKPDLVVLTGDYVSRPEAITAEYGKLLATLEAPLGVFAVLGNHDHWTDAPRVTEMLRAAGIRLLANTHVVLRRGTARLCLAGVADLWEDDPSVERALAGVDEGVPRVLLCHNPDYAEAMPARPRVDVVFAGHTHGGQVKIPFGPRPRLPVKHKKYGSGLVEGPHCPVYVSRGIGMVGIPMRFNCRPEIPIITLRGATTK